MKPAWLVFIGILFIFLFLLLVRPVLAQVKINEFSSETSDDWVEFYSMEDVDISGWILRDNAASIVATVPKETKIGLGTNQFYIIDAGNRLNKDSDLIKLFKSDDSTLVNQVSYGPQEDLCAPESGQTAGRLPDGSDKFTRFASATKLQSNTAPEIPCPSPSPSPSPSPETNPSPSPATSTSSNQMAASPSPAPSPSALPTPQPSKIYRIKEITLLNRETPEPVLGTQNSQPDWQLAIMLLITGTGLLIVTAIIIVRLWRKN